MASSTSKDQRFFLQGKTGSRKSATDLRIVLLGKTGSGKSATGNTILRRDAFEAEMSASSVTKECKKQTVLLNDRAVTVIDTPGMFDTTIPEKELKREIENCIMLSLPGPHIFLLVINLSARFTEEEKNTISWITKNFGEEVAKYTIVVFTRGDYLKGSIENYLHKSADLKKLTSDCKAGYAVFDNTNRRNHTQVADLFENIDRVVELNGGHYSSNIYEAAQNKLWWRSVRGAAAEGLILAAPVVGGVMAGNSKAFSAMLALSGSLAFTKWWNRPKTDESEGNKKNDWHSQACSNFTYVQSYSIETRFHPC